MPLAERLGGSETLLLDLLRSNRSSGIDWVVVFLQDGPMVTEVNDLGFPAYVVDAGRLRQPIRIVRAALAIRRIVANEHVDAVLGWMAKAHIFNWLATSGTSKPLIWYRHEIPHRDAITVLTALMPATMILACSHAAAISQARWTRQTPILVVYPGVDTHRFFRCQLGTREEILGEIGLPPDVRTVGLVGRLQVWKGAHILLSAVALMSLRHPNLHCLIVGGRHALEPAYETYLRKRAAELGILDKVHILGFQRDVRRSLAAMDVVVNASTAEPFGIGVVEAMAMGKFVVAVNSGGPSEIIQHGISGLLIDSAEPTALAAAVRSGLEDTELCRTIENAACERAKNFSIERFVSQLAATIRNAIPHSAEL